MSHGEKQLSPASPLHPDCFASTCCPPPPFLTLCSHSALSRLPQHRFLRSDWSVRRRRRSLRCTSDIFSVRRELTVSVQTSHESGRNWGVRADTVRFNFFIFTLKTLNSIVVLFIKRGEHGLKERIWKQTLSRCLPFVVSCLLPASLCLTKITDLTNKRECRTKAKP